MVGGMLEGVVEIAKKMVCFRMAQQIVSVV
jgi:hypothetical protein